jgi:Right handed beta helix region
MRRVVPVALLGLLVLFAIGARGQAPSPGCSTTAQPGASINAAISAAPAGHTICLSAGSYGRISTSAVKQGVTVRPLDGATATVAGAFLKSASGITLQGLDITPEGVIVRGSTGITVESNHIHDIRRDPSCPSAPNEGSGYGISVGIYGSTPSRQVAFRNNRIERVPHDGIHIGSTHELLIEGNEITEVRPAACGDHTDSIQWVAGTRITIRRNHIHHNTHGFMVDGHDTTFRGEGRFENNLVHDIKSIAFNLYNVDGLALVNNTVWDTGVVAVRLRDEGNPTVMRATVRNNLFEEYSNHCGSCVTAEQNNLVGGDPVFGPGYELGPGSPAIDAGTSVDAPVVDRLGRPRDAQPDIGAHEVPVAHGPGAELGPSPGLRRSGRAGRVHTRKGHLIAVGAPRTPNRLTARRRGRIWRISDPAAPLRAGRGCRRVRRRVVTCPASGVRRVVLIGGAGDDRLKLVGRGRALLLGGAGDDRLVARLARALLRGGHGQDRLIGRPAADFRGGPDADRRMLRPAYRRGG